MIPFKQAKPFRIQRSSKEKNRSLSNVSVNIKKITNAAEDPKEPNNLEQRSRQKKQLVTDKNDRSCSNTLKPVPNFLAAEHEAGPRGVPGDLVSFSESFADAVYAELDRVQEEESDRQLEKVNSSEKSSDPLADEAHSKSDEKNEEECDNKNQLEAAESQKQKETADASSEGRAPECSLEAWDLPEAVLLQYKRRGVTSMFQWQAECLTRGRALDGGNLVYSAPTSAGKTLVAELLVLKNVLETKKKALFILPFVSVAREKMTYLQSLFQNAGLRVDGYMGSHNPAGGLRAVDVAVCTIEKANGLVNRLMEEGKLNSLGIVVVDEMHMLGDPHRGYLLELLLTKILYISKNKEEDTSIQIIGMSATLPNLQTLADWLCADLYHTDFRPVPLTECCKFGNKLLETSSMKVIREINETLKLPGIVDQDHSIQLAVETVAENHSVLVFCPTKQWCEQLALSIARTIYELGRPRKPEEHTLSPFEQSLGDSLCTVLKDEPLVVVLKQLQNCPAGLDSNLAKSIPFGVAFHHAGLTMYERDIVEGAFRQGSVRVLVATSTLSSGVNLPARRVIIRSAFMRGTLVDVLSYKQMAGRAGRMGVDTQGQSILICKENEQNQVLKLVSSELSPVQSCLVRPGEQNLSSSLKRAILEVIASGVASSPDDIRLYASCTLLAATLRQEDPDSAWKENSIEMCVLHLVENEFISLVETEKDGATTTKYVASQLGRAVLASSLTPDEGLNILKELGKAQKCFVLDNELHLIYQVTPPYLSAQMSSLDWLHYLSLWRNLSESFRMVGELVGVEERFLARSVHCPPTGKSSRQAESLKVHRRFYAALALHDLVQERTLADVAVKYALPKGLLQSLQQSASTFAGMVTVFCSRLGWRLLELLIAQFQSRLHFGIQEELCDLVALHTVDGQRARALYNAGYETVALLAASDPREIEIAIKNACPFRSSKVIPEDNTTSTAQLVFISGFGSMTYSQAAELIVKEAKYRFQSELGLKSVQWQEKNDISNVSRKEDCSVNGEVAGRRASDVSTVNRFSTVDCRSTGSATVQAGKNFSSKNSLEEQINNRLSTEEATSNSVTKPTTSGLIPDSTRKDTVSKTVPSSISKPTTSRNVSDPVNNDEVPGSVSSSSTKDKILKNESKLFTKDMASRNTSNSITKKRASKTSSNSNTKESTYKKTPPNSIAKYMISRNVATPIVRSVSCKLKENSDNNTSQSTLSTVTVQRPSECSPQVKRPNCASNQIVQSISACDGNENSCNDSVADLQKQALNTNTKNTDNNNSVNSFKFIVKHSSNLNGESDIMKDKNNHICKAALVNGNRHVASVLYSAETALCGQNVRNDLPSLTAINNYSKECTIPKNFESEFDFSSVELNRMSEKRQDSMKKKICNTTFLTTSPQVPETPKLSNKRAHRETDPLTTSLVEAMIQESGELSYTVGSNDKFSDRNQILTPKNITSTSLVEALFQEPSERSFVDRTVGLKIENSKKARILTPNKCLPKQVQSFGKDPCLPEENSCEPSYVLDSSLTDFAVGANTSAKDGSAICDETVVPENKSSSSLCDDDDEIIQLDESIDFDSLHLNRRSSTGCRLQFSIKTFSRLMSCIQNEIKSGTVVSPGCFVKSLKEYAEQCKTNSIPEGRVKPDGSQPAGFHSKASVDKKLSNELNGGISRQSLAAVENNEVYALPDSEDLFADSDPDVSAKQLKTPDRSSTSVELFSSPPEPPNLDNDNDIPVAQFPSSAPESDENSLLNITSQDLNAAVCFNTPFLLTSETPSTQKRSSPRQTLTNISNTTNFFQLCNFSQLSPIDQSFLKKAAERCLPAEVSKTISSKLNRSSSVELSDSAILAINNMSLDSFSEKSKSPDQPFTNIKTRIDFAVQQGVVSGDASPDTQMPRVLKRKTSPSNLKDRLSENLFTTPSPPKLAKHMSPTSRDESGIRKAANVSSVSQVITRSRALDDAASSLVTEIENTNGAFCIIDVAADKELFQMFVKEVLTKDVVAISLACVKKARPSQSVKRIGSTIKSGTKGHNVKEASQNSSLLVDETLICGISFCWEDQDAYYLSLATGDDDSIQIPTEQSLLQQHRIEVVHRFLESSSQRKVVCFDLKHQWHLLSRGCGLESAPGTIRWLDPKLADWLLNSGEKQKTLHSLTLNHCPQLIHLLSNIGGTSGIRSIGTMTGSHGSARIRAATESVLALHVIRDQMRRLQELDIEHHFLEVEMPSVILFGQMEENGIGFDRECASCLQETLQRHLLALEGRAHRLAGRKFSLSSYLDISKVLYKELRLCVPGVPVPVPVGHARSKQNTVNSTGKGALEKMKEFHPLPGIILEWRRVSSALTKVLLPLLRESQFCPSVNMHRILGEVCMTASTGRISMREPSLLTIPREFPITTNETTNESNVSTVSLRNAFVPFDGAVFLSADYSQLELRILAYLSGDTFLLKSLNSGLDVFASIASRWLGIQAEEVSKDQRQRAKQMCYGMIYGIGKKTLADQLNVEEQDAAIFMENFQTAYPGIKKYIGNVVETCREKGYVQTIFGRRRYLPNITSTNGQQKAGAERQAVNTCIQGSAADLVKMAMLRIQKTLHSMFSGCNKTIQASGYPLKRGVYFVLQLHDELLYEVPVSCLRSVAKVVKRNMESVAPKGILLPVNLKSGPTWGQLSDLHL